MPRNPAKRSNNRHENGLVGPGKRVSKQKSNSQLNGSVKPPPIATDIPLPTHSNVQSPVTAHQEATSTAVDPDLPSVNGIASDDLRWRKRDSESSIDPQDSKWDNVNGGAQHASKRVDMLNKNKSPQDISTMQIASTILKSCPAGDTLALLIVLLALPSMVLTLVQVLFASLTLMPPTSSVSSISFLSLFDVFQGSAGSPSLSTMAVMDIICFGVWVGLWNWAQNFALDLAQIQIAITLGSGNSSKNNTVSAVSLSLVVMLHSIRSRGFRRFVTTSVLPESLWSHPQLSPYLSWLPNEADFGQSPGAPSKWRSFFAIHIISQALMAFIRRRVAGTSTVTKAAKRTDADLFGGTSTSLEPIAQDTLFNNAASSGVDHAQPPTPLVREFKDKALTAKKRRRQANQVRSRQPFWAALASTKVHVLREVEQNKDKQGGPAQENAARCELNESIWITHVEPSTIEFEAGNCIDPELLEDERSAEIDKVFCVRVNGAQWHSVMLDYVDNELQQDQSPTKWAGSISGLAPDCTYTCAFIRFEDGKEVAITSIKVRTPPMSEADQSASMAPVPARTSLRPSSPTSTLKTSIQQAELKREEANNRRSKVRRYHKSQLTKMDKEIENWQHKLKAGSDDTKLRQKLLQADRSSKAHEEATNTLAATIAELETIPEEESEAYDQKKAAFERSNRQLSEANDSLSYARDEAKAELDAAKADLTSTSTRKDRLVTRNAKLTAEAERLTQANIENLSEKERKARESEAREMEQKRMEDEWRTRLNQISAQLTEIRNQNQSLWAEISAYDESQRNMTSVHNGPLTPEGELPGTNFPHAPTSHFLQAPASTFVPDPLASSFVTQSKPFLGDYQRPRSGTNQSGASGFSLDFDDADPIPPALRAAEFENGINGRRGSGSSRGKNNHSPATAAGVFGSTFSPHRGGSNSPGHLQGTSTW